MARWVTRNSDGVWMVKGTNDPALILAQPASYTEIDVPGDLPPDPRLERYDSSSVSKRRGATVAEIQAWDEEQADRAANALHNTDKDRLATFATMAEAYNSAWPSMTNAQRRTEVVRLANRWEQQRNWVTRNYAFMVF